MVTRNTDVYVVPRVTQEPLAHIETGVELAVLGSQDNWYLIQYDSPRWGARRAFIDSEAVKPIQVNVQQTSTVNAPSVPPLAPAASAQVSQVVPSDGKKDHPKWRAFGEGVALGLMAIAAGMAAQGVASGSAYSAADSLLIFGGDGHHVFLGCLNCGRYDTDSVFNSYGNYGSRYSSESVLNPYSDYGSRYSDYGACNPYAQDPPVIVDRAGNFYGRLTLNRYHPQRTRNAQTLAWLAGVCAR
jgi:hypothetical protein